MTIPIFDQHSARKAVAEQEPSILSIGEIFGWLDSVLNTTQARLNAFLEDFRNIMTDLKLIQSQFGSGELDEEGARRRASELQIEERLEINASLGDKAHLLSSDELRGELPESSFQALTARLGLRPGSVGSDYRFPHCGSGQKLKYCHGA